MQVDAVKLLKEIRGKRRLSQRSLALKAGLSFGCVQRMETDAHDWRVGSMRRLARALDLPPDGVDYFMARYLALVPDSVEDVSLRIHGDGFDSWPTHLFNLVDRFRSQPDSELIRQAPIQELDPRLRALIASTVETLCADVDQRAPVWVHGILGLDAPWFVAGVENLKALALVESPTSFRKRNIFVLGNILYRA